MPTTTAPSIRERLNLGVHNNGQEQELLVVAVADPHKVVYCSSVIIYHPNMIVYLPYEIVYLPTVIVTTLL